MLFLVNIVNGFLPVTIIRKKFEHVCVTGFSIRLCYGPHGPHYYLTIDES